MAHFQQQIAVVVDYRVRIGMPPAQVKESNEQRSYHEEPGFK